HHTLQATMDWSWDLLPAGERTALARLSVFPADFDLDAAEAVVAPGGSDGSDLVLRLVDKSLVAAITDGPQMRYRLLGTVRSYAASKLAETGDGDSARRAHCEHFLQRADRLAADYWAMDRWFTGVAADEASFRAAIEGCLATDRREDALRLMAAYWFYAFQSNPSAGGLLLARCMADPRPVPSPALVECLRALVLLPEGRRDSTCGVESILRDALDMARGLGDTSGENRVLYFLGSALVNQGRFDEGHALLLAARDYFAAHGERVAQSWAEHELGWECMFQGDHAGARACFEAGLVSVGEGRLRDDAVDRFSAATLWSDLATLGAVDGAENRARQDAARAVATARQLPIGGVLLMALCRAAEVALRIDDVVMAVESLAELLVTLRDVGDWHWAAGALEDTVCLLEPRGAEEAGIETRLLAAGAEIRRKLGEGAPNVAVADRLTKRRAEIAAFLGPEGLADETDRGRRASSDEALRWALELLRNRHFPQRPAARSPSAESQSERPSCPL
ncbi:MAG: hypothetical protein LC792_07435, partial [Actinobacteria bacterium]|nr:hypothetical protein [Actinomycetota bacterium]